MVPQLLRLIAVGVLFWGIILRIKPNAPRQGSDAFYIPAAAIFLQLAVLAWRAAVTGFFPLAGMSDVLVFLSAIILAAHLAFTRGKAADWTASGIYMAAALMLAVSALMPARNDVPEDLRSYMLPIHVGGAVVAYGLLTLHIVLMLQWALRARTAGGAAAPEAASLARRAVRLAFAGTIIYGIFVLGIGMIWAKLAWGRYWGWDPKEILSLLTSGLYLVYLYFELVMRPRSPWLRLGMAAAAYAFLLLAFFFGARISALHGYA